mgnify:FL=1
MTPRERADALLPYMTEIRHDLHMHPELGLREFHATELVKTELDKMGIPYTCFEPTGLMCEIQGELPGDGYVGLRADMDALPLDEAVDLPYKSVNPGVMHACGHDMHTTMLLTAVKILNDMKSEFGGKVRFVFQPGEEGCNGAKVIEKQGAMDGPKKYMAIHMWPNYVGTGKVGHFDIARTAGTDNFKVTVKGQICHGQAPHLGIDSLTTAANMIMALQTLVSRRTNPLDAAVVSIGKIHGGTAANIVCPETVFEGTIRCHVPEHIAKLKTLLYETCEHIAKAHGATVEIEYETYAPPMVQDPELSKIAWAAADKVVGGKAPCLHMGDIMGGEDFTVFQQHAPGVYVFLGGGGDAMGHQSDFWLEDSAMPYGAALYAQFALDALKLD